MENRLAHATSLQRPSSLSSAALDRRNTAIPRGGSSLSSNRRAPDRVKPAFGVGSGSSRYRDGRYAVSAPRHNAPIRHNDYRRPNYHGGHNHHHHHGRHHHRGSSFFWGLALGSIWSPGWSSYNYGWGGGWYGWGGSRNWGFGFSYSPYYAPSYYDPWFNGGWGYDGWYGGFSYTYNPWPVYRSYYFYDPVPVAETVYVTQPSTTPQVIYMNEAPAAATAYAQPDYSATLWDAAPATAQAETAAIGCSCACHCNGERPCICEYPCGAEYTLYPEDFDLTAYRSYADTLDPETIWASYAGFDRWDDSRTSISTTISYSR